MNTWNFLVDLTLKSTLVLGLAWCVGFVLHRRSAAARHIVWTAAFCALLALPLLSLGLPAWHHPLVNAILPDASGLTFRATASSEVANTPTVAAQPASSTASAPTPFDTRTALAIAWTAGAGLALLHMIFAYAAMWR